MERRGAARGVLVRVITAGGYVLLYRLVPVAPDEVLGPRLHASGIGYDLWLRQGPRATYIQEGSEAHG